MDAYQTAGDAIEAFVAKHFSEQSGQWQEVVPAELWGFTLDGWEAAASEIVANFNSRLPPAAQIAMSRKTKRGTAKVPLIDLQRLLAAMVEAAVKAAGVILIKEALGL